MKPEIKQRIIQLNNGEIPNGYKKTSVGIVPIEWTEHTLGDIFKFKNGINKEKEAFGQGTPIVNYTDVWKKRGLKAEDIKGRVVLSKNEIQNYEVKCGDVFFTRTSETIEEIGYSSVLLDDIENAIFSGFVLRARPYNNLVSREYHQYCYSEPQMRHEIIKRSSMTTRALTSGSMLSQVAINLPSHREQSKIAEILMKWDETIELYNQQIEKLKQLKSICLKKMFPQKGERVPEWRFKGFSDAWEQRKLGDIGSVSMCRRIFKEQTSESGEIPFYKIGTFGGEADAFISRELFDEYKDKYSYPKKGDILISASGSIGRTVEFTGKNEYFQDSNIVWLNHDEHLDNSFLKCFYSVVKWAGIEGSTIKRLYNDNILNTVITLPSIAEQKKIGTYFESLDNLITLHQYKVEKIKAQQKVLQKYLLNGIVRV